MASLRFASRQPLWRQKLQPPVLKISRMLSAVAQSPNDVRKMLEEPSWSVKSMLGDGEASLPAISQKQLHHLLRLSALPLPKSVAEEAKMIEDLQAQLHFVQAIQKLDTEGVEPLQSIRDETKHGEREGTIRVESLKEEFGKEVVVGKRGRITRKKDLPPVTEEGIEDWDPLAQAPKKIGRYFVVETDKD